MAGFRGPPEHPAGSHGRQQTHPGYGGFADHGGRAGDALKGHREGPGSHPMGDCCMSAGEVNAPGKTATTTLGKPPKVVRMLAFMLRFLFNTPPYLPKSSWRGCSDASASDEGLAFVGGWCSNKVEPEKKEVYWFHEQIHVEEYPWAFKNGDPKRRIAEMLGTLFLCNMILTHQGPLSSRVRLPAHKHNQGNVMAMLNLGSKKPYTAAILMELVFLLHTHGCSLAANHVPREFNQWADELTHPDFSGFDPLHRVPKQELCEDFVFLPRLLDGDAFDLSVGPPMLL